MNKGGLLARKIAIAFGIGVGLAVISKAGPAIDGIENQDWPAAADAGRVVLAGAVAGGLRGLVSLLTAFVPSDGLIGKNAIGKFKNGD